MAGRRARLRQGVSGMLRDLGIVCQTASTGGMRYAVMLAAAIRRRAPHVAVTLHHSPRLLTDHARTELEGVGVRLTDRVRMRYRPPVQQAAGAANPPGRRVRLSLRGQFRRLAASARSRRHDRRAARYARILARHDVVHFAWPYDIEPVPLDVPMTFIPHDFIHDHEFGVFTYSQEAWRSTNAGLRDWLAAATPIVSSDFVAAELARAFPDHRQPVPVVYLSSLHAGQRRAGRDEAPAAVCERLGIGGRFLLCPNNLMPHKNLGLLLTALWHVRQAGEDVRLVVSGVGTQGIRARIDSPLYGDRVADDAPWHVLGVGVVSEEDLLAVMRAALLVVNPSLCEAGSGSGLDAWGCGCAVALADIPAFRDQVRFLGTRAAFFDPRDPRDAARVLLAMIRDPDGRAADGAASRAALERYDWNAVADRYLDIFERLCAARASRPR